MKESSLSPIIPVTAEEKIYDQAKCREIAAALRIPFELAVLLYQRDCTSADQASAFLYPQLKNLPAPDQMKDMGKAVDLIFEAFRKQETVLVHGDYDVDGKSATTLLVDFLSSLGMRVKYHVPQRLDQGYGLHRKTLERLLQEYTETGLLLVTVDCGITANEEVEFLKKRGVKVLVTDHHEPPAILPEADAILNPKQKGCNFPFKELAGVGVALYLVMGLRQRLLAEGFWTQESVPNLKKYLDLVALGTVADVMPLVGINRILVRAGLEVLSDRFRPGIWALCEQSGIENRAPLTAEDVSFRIAPRLNAAGRIGNPELSVKLLLSKDSSEAMELAAQLETLNVRRKELEIRAAETAEEQCERQYRQGSRVLVAYGEYHPGIVGIVAARIAEKFDRPVIVFTDDTVETKRLKGSGRSVKSLNIYKIISKCSDITEQYGGHAMAIGVTIAKHSLELFKDALNEAVSSAGSEIDAAGNSNFQVDYKFSGQNFISDHLIEVLQLLGPFGEGNPEPIFLLENVQLIQPTVIKSHLKFFVEHNGLLLNGIAFGMSEQLRITDRPVSLGVKLRHSFFRNRRRVELHTVFMAPVV